jgi:REP element-mobilizing transposase RayT
MSEKYKMRDPEKAYFVTLTVVDWIDVFIRKNHRFTIVESLIYCQQHKGLEIYGWCLMSNHLHMIAKATGSQSMSEILRDFKKYTAKAIIQKSIIEPKNRRKWMLDRFAYSGKHLKRIENYKFWKDGNHGITIFNNKTFFQILKYIHMNPVKAMIVTNPEDYYFSSARNYAGLDYLLPIVLETQELMEK